MKHRPLLKNACNATGKHCYQSRSLARQHKRKMCRRYGESYDVYVCKHCGFYHVGRPGWQKRLSRRKTG